MSDEYSLTIIHDDREKKPLDFSGLPVTVEVDRFDTADYTTPDLLGRAGIERKSLDDLANSCGTNRDRFKAQVKRGMELERFAVVIEHPREPLQAYADRRVNHCPLYYSRIVPQAITGTVDSWSAKYDVDFYWVPDRSYAALRVYSLLNEWENDLA